MARLIQAGAPCQSSSRGIQRGLDAAGASRECVVGEAGKQFGTPGFGTALLLPRFGILGYGWAELAACVAYATLHTRAPQIAPVSLNKLALLLSVFVSPLFSLLVHGAWGFVLYLPLALFPIRFLWRTGRPTRAEETSRGAGGIFPLLTSMRTRLMRTGL